ncbi:MAG: hypothetical protein RUDDFDWM_002032, partial [Candidatus Fervidibacterota bacterium]
RTPLTLVSAFATVSAQAAQCIPSTPRLYRRIIFVHPKERIKRQARDYSLNALCQNFSCNGKAMNVLFTLVGSVAKFDFKERLSNSN